MCRVLLACQLRATDLFRVPLIDSQKLNFLKDSNDNCTVLIHDIRDSFLKSTYFRHHSFFRYLPPLLWRELVLKGKNINWFWLEVYKKDKLKDRNQKQNDASICGWKLFLLKSNKFLPFHTSWSSKSEGLLMTFKRRKPVAVQEKNHVASFIFPSWAGTWKKLMLSLLLGKS